MTPVGRYKNLVPLSRVVNASILDTWDDSNKMQQVMYHFAARGLKKLQTETLKRGKHSVTLFVSPNTHTATLPCDFDGEIGVYIINSKREKESLILNPKLTNTRYIEDIPCEDKCEKCNQDKAICDDIKITSTKELVNINGNTYEKTIVKKLHDNGDYYLETTTPILNTQTSVIEYITTKEFIAHLDLKECGCLENSDANILKIQACCDDVYCKYYATFCPCSRQWGSYKIFEENGLIQFDIHFPFDKVYLEYYGFIPKVNGEYQVPEVAFETLVEWTKFKSVENKKSVTLSERNWYFENYKRERRNMERILGRVSINQIIQAVGLNPKFG